MRFILETKLGKLKVSGIRFKNQWEEWCLDDKKRCLDSICVGRWKETGQGIIASGDVNLEERKIRQIPFKFYRVENGAFYIFNNLLTSLIGSPEYIKYDFIAYVNKLQNLIGGPEKIEKGGYDVHKNQINSLEGAPKYVGWWFDIREQQPPGKQWTKEDIREKIKVWGVIFI